MKVLFLQSTLGNKYVMAITGGVLFVFVILHLLGNLQIFMGPEQINAYGELLRMNPAVLWTARLGLLVMAVLHVVSAAKLSAANRAARPVEYGEKRFVAASYASRTMLMSGLIVLAFVVYHLLHFTVQTPAVSLAGGNAEMPAGGFAELRDAEGRHDVYRMMLIGFSSYLVSGFYVVGVGLLTFHLSHGVSSMFQSFGVVNKRYRGWLERFAYGSALVLFVGYISIPLAVLIDRRWNLIRIFE